MTTLVGAVLMITAGALAVNFHSSRYSQRNYYKDSEVMSHVTFHSLKWDKHCLHLAQAGIALGVIAIIAGIVFIVDFIFAVRKLKVSIG